MLENGVEKNSPVFFYETSRVWNSNMWQIFNGEHVLHAIRSKIHVCFFTFQPRQTWAASDSPWYGTGQLGSILTSLPIHKYIAHPQSSFSPSPLLPSSPRLTALNSELWRAPTHAVFSSNKCTRVYVLPSISPRTPITYIVSTAPHKTGLSPAL